MKYNKAKNDKVFDTLSFFSFNNKKVILFIF